MVLKEEVCEDEGVYVSFACYSCGGDGNDARDGAGVGDACAGVRVQRQQSPAVFASPKAAGLYLIRYGCPKNSRASSRTASSSTLLARGRLARGRCRVDLHRGITFGTSSAKNGVPPFLWFSSHPSCAFRRWLIVCLSSVFSSGSYGYK